jgi:transcription elongation factor Elf1
VPDKDGRWTPDELGRFKTWREAKFPRDLTCSACGSAEFAISPTCLVRVGVSTVDGRTGIDPSRGHPEIVLVCTNCALSLSFSAQRAGMV